MFDGVSKDDLIIAFFPCIYFSSVQMTYYSLESINNKNKDVCGRIIDAIERLQKRTYMHRLLYQLYSITAARQIPLIIENPYNESGYLTGIQNFPKPKVIDKDRTLRGDYFIKPTAYWFFNCEPTNGLTIQATPKNEIKRIKKCRKGLRSGLCCEERSIISKNYARNFIFDFILGKKQDIGQLSLF